VLARLALVCRGSDEIRPNSILTHYLDPGSCSWRQPELIRPSPNSFCQLTKPILVAKLGTPMLTKKNSMTDRVQTIPACRDRSLHS
jgi:hypothetical protein